MSSNVQPVFANSNDVVSTLQVKSLLHLLIKAEKCFVSTGVLKGVELHFESMISGKQSFRNL